MDAEEEKIQHLLEYIDLLETMNDHLMEFLKKKDPKKYVELVLKTDEIKTEIKQKIDAG